jgi:predicted RNA-binding protein YlxR (DUF448 family)
MKRISDHHKKCEAAMEVRAGTKRTVWMTPQLDQGRVFYVCADANCPAKLIVLNLSRVKLPSL